MNDNFIIEIKKTDELNMFLNEKKDFIYLVDFYANWCGPCKDFGKMIKKNIKKLLNITDKLRILKVNVDDENIDVSNFEITGIPRFIIVKNQKILIDETGNQPYESIEKYIIKIIE